MIEPMRCDVWWAHPTAATPALVGLLDEIEQGRYTGYRREVDQLRFLTGRALIRGVVASTLGVPASSVALDASCFDCGKPHGKPRVVGSTLEVSVSHSGEWVVLAVASSTPVGVDVEELRAAEVDDLAGVAFSAAEQASFSAVPAADRRGAFFTYWSRKEAVLKATGKGMSVPMSKLTLSAHDAAPAVLSSETPEVDAAAARMADLNVGPNYRACVAAFAPTPLSITEHDATELLKALG